MGNVSNNLNLIGRLVRDPELRYTPNGMAVVNVTLAVDKQLSAAKREEYKSKGMPTADFPRVIIWGKLAELCGNSLKKGSMVAISGSIQTSSYKTNSGETRYSTDVVAESVRFLDSKAKAESEGEDFNFGGYNPEDFQAIEDDEDIPF